MSYSSKKILSIDDDPSFNLLLKKYISATPYKLISTDNSKDFFDAYTKEKPDICLLDLNINDHLDSGLKLLQLIRSTIDKNIPIIIISKSSSNKEVTYAFELGANDFLPKPLDNISLVEKLKFFLHGPTQSSDLPMFLVTETQRPCEFFLNFEIFEINEYGITFKTPHYITRGTSLTLKGEEVLELTGKISFKCAVHDCWVADNDFFYFSIEFPDDRDMITHIRRWMYRKRIEQIGMKVMVVDDDQSARALLSKQLTGIKKEVSIIEFQAGHDAIEFLNKNTVDMIISDYEMENGTGMDILNYVREKKLKVPFLLISSKDKERITPPFNAIDASKEFYYKKPVSNEQLKNHLIPKTPAITPQES